mgnify:CR=1 FL=1
MKATIKRNPFNARYFYQLMWNNDTPAVESTRMYKTEQECEESLNKFMTMIGVTPSIDRSSDHVSNILDGKKMIDEGRVMMGRERFLS